MDIAPELGRENIVVSIDGRTTSVLALNKVREAAGPNQHMFGYLIQAGLPQRDSKGQESFITITLDDPKTGEKGEASVFVRA